MRARSNTICCDSLEDYIEAAKRTTSYLPSRRVHPHSKKSFSPVNKKQYKEAVLDEEDDSCNLKEADQGQSSLDSWLDFDYDSNKVQSSDQASSLSLTQNTLDTDYSDDAETKSSRSTRQSLLRKIMIVGLDGIGKHSLINTAFDCEMQSFQAKNQVLDLLTKTEQDEEDDKEVRYQFWIHNLKTNGDKTKSLIQDLVKLYYKNVSMFVFMYSITDKESFRRLEDAIKDVLQEIPAEKFVGVLVGTKSDSEDQREVSLCDAMSLQEQYSLSSFVETNHNDKSFKGVFTELLVKNEEELKDVPTERRVSILSID